MDKKKFLNIEIDEPPIELQLSVEMRIREVLKSDDNEGVKNYCTDLIRHQMRQDVLLTGVLSRVLELEAILAKIDIKELAKIDIGEEYKTIDRIRSFFHI
mgnify:FL=1|tara:strand:- start:554 stop:853 length:300 start_codon:yes stop_codon:yes gene_type:complete